MYLHIYLSRDLLKEPFRPHPCNPVYRDVRFSRPAGALFHDESGRLIRPAQICAPRYGSGIQFMQVETLSPEMFKESPLYSFKADWQKGLMGTHTFNRTGNMMVGDVQVAI
jgi:hypothetical protein